MHFHLENKDKVQEKEIIVISLFNSSFINILIPYPKNVVNTHTHIILLYTCKKKWNPVMLFSIFVFHLTKCAYECYFF